jgi:tripartite-type tricarboxylate transporter receptor subunit TctC
MNIPSRTLLACAGLAALAAALASHAPSAAAAGFPDRVVKVVVPYGPGGGADSFTRPLAAQLGTQLGHQVIVDNRAGAGGTIGVKAVATAPADGYTLLAGGVHQPMAEGLYPGRGYDMDKDFVPLAITAVVPNVLVVRAGLPLRTVAELVNYAKANPDRLSYCSSGAGTSQHIIAEMFKAATGIRMLHVPHKGTAAAMTTFLSGQCDLMFDGLATSIPHMRSGRLVGLALTTARRSPHYRDLPTMQEAGGPAMDVGTWYAWWAPAATPRDVVLKLRKEMAAALNAAPVRQAWAAQGAEPSAVTADNVEAFVRAEIARWIRATREAKITID